jgi:putative NADH-flavin reductase
MKPIRIVIYGANGRVGRRTVAEAVARGHHVTAVVRNPAAAAFAPAVRVLKGDASDPDSVAETAASEEVAISTVGGLMSDTAGSLYVDAAHGLLAGLPRADVRRLIVTGGSGGLEVSPGVPGVDTPDFPEFAKPDALAQISALNVYKSADTSVNWTYVSPAADFEPGTRTGRYRVDGDRLLVDEEGHSTLSMEDYAIALLDEAEAGKHPRQRISVAY